MGNTLEPVEVKFAEDGYADVTDTWVLSLPQFEAVQRVDGTPWSDSDAVYFIGKTRLSSNNDGPTEDATRRRDRQRPVVEGLAPL